MKRHKGRKKEEKRNIKRKQIIINKERINEITQMELKKKRNKEITNDWKERKKELALRVVSTDSFHVMIW